MKNLIRLAVAVVLVFCAVPVFAGTAGIDVHEDGPDTLLGVGYEEDGKYQRVVAILTKSQNHSLIGLDKFRDLIYKKQFLVL